MLHINHAFVDCNILPNFLIRKRPNSVGSHNPILRLGCLIKIIRNSVARVNMLLYLQTWRANSVPFKLVPK